MVRKKCQVLFITQYTQIAEVMVLQRAYGLEIPQTLEETCTPQRTALIVYDMQIGILGQLAQGEAVLAKVQQVLAAARSARLRVFFMRHLSLPKEAAGVFQLHMAMRWQRAANVEDVQPWFLRDSPGFPITPELEPLPSEVVFDKITMSAFEGTPLNIALRDCGINSFIIVGVATEIGIDPTVKHGADLGYIPIIVRDACGAGHHEAGERALENLAFAGDAILTDTKTIGDVLAKSGASA